MYKSILEGFILRKVSSVADGTVESSKEPFIRKESVTRTLRASSYEVELSKKAGTVGHSKNL